MIRFFEERFLLSNILEVGKILILGAGLYENYYIASKGFSTVCVNVQKALNHFIVAKMMRKPVNIDLYSVNLGGFNFPYEFFDYAAFLNNSFELIPYRTNRMDMLKFTNRFLKNDSFLSLSLYNPLNKENISSFEKGEFIKQPSNQDLSDKSNVSEPILNVGDYFYKSSGTSEEKFRHIFDEEELRKDLKDCGFEVIEFTDDEHVVKRQSKRFTKMNQLNGKFIIVSARKINTVKISREVD